MRRLFKVRVLWMMDNEPGVVKELLEKGDLGELERQVDNKIYYAHQYKTRLQKADPGLSDPEAEDESVRAILAPAREWGQEEPPNPLSDQDRNRVLNRLEDRAELQDKREYQEQ